MSKIAVVYWSGTGNTQSMAEAVKAGAESSGASVDMFTPSEFSSSMVSGYDAIAFGCPAMGAEVLEETEFRGNHWGVAIFFYKSSYVLVIFLTIHQKK